jgi:endonuclease-3
MIRHIIYELKKKHGPLECFLNYNNAFELICAVCLSAQCTDERVNKTTPGLFKKYPDPYKLAEAKQSDVEKLIKSCGFYKNKAHNLIKMSQRLVSHHQGEVPDTIEELTQLAGVGRKTANVVLGTWFNKSAGVVVDTHVSRITKLLGLTKSKDPKKIEKELNRIIPPKYWDQFSLWLIAHGRETCIARRPKCSICCLNKYCSHAKKLGV